MRTSTPEFCATCHEIQFAYNTWKTSSHDVTERLAWETQAPSTVRPQNFKPFAAKINHEVERQNRKYETTQRAASQVIQTSFLLIAQKPCSQNRLQGFVLLDNGKGLRAKRMA